MTTAQADNRYAYRLSCECIGLGDAGLVPGQDCLLCQLHDYQLVAGLGIRWAKLQAEAAGPFFPAKQEVLSA